MLIIRKEQMHVFSEAAVQEFQEWMLVHMRKFFPACRNASEPFLRELIRYGTERANLHAIRTCRDVCNYIDLMIVLGRDFDERFPWAWSILNTDGASAIRMEWLTASAQRHLERESSRTAKA